jgi:hypothetical protein
MFFIEKIISSWLSVYRISWLKLRGEGYMGARVGVDLYMSENFEIEIR